MRERDEKNYTVKFIFLKYNTNMYAYLITMMCMSKGTTIEIQTTNQSHKFISFWVTWAQNELDITDSLRQKRFACHANAINGSIYEHTFVKKEATPVVAILFWMFF